MINADTKQRRDVILTTLSLLTGYRDDMLKRKGVCAFLESALVTRMGYSPEFSHTVVQALINRWSHEWSLYSGDIEYPVPYFNGKVSRNKREYIFHNLPLWGNTAFGDDRRAFCSFLKEKLTNHWGR